VESARDRRGGVCAEVGRKKCRGGGELMPRNEINPDEKAQKK